jgi:hypothetical protein
MVPSFIVFLDELPLTSSGKLNRKSLPQPDMAVVKNTIIAPTTEYEKKLVDLWRALLKIEHISIGDNFFDVGGNSILAINLANQVSKEFSQPVKALMIFEYPTIKDQSEFLSGKRGDQSASKNIEIHEQAQRKKNVNFRRTRN